MKRRGSECCPHCGCGEVSKTKNKGSLEIGPFELEDQEESLPVDIWMCSVCQRRFVILDTENDE